MAKVTRENTEQESNMKLEKPSKRFIVVIFVACILAVFFSSTQSIYVTCGNANSPLIYNVRIEVNSFGLVRSISSMTNSSRFVEGNELYVFQTAESATLSISKQIKSEAEKVFAQTENRPAYPVVISINTTGFPRNNVKLSKNLAAKLLENNIVVEAYADNKIEPKDKLN